jgi:DNA polymerase III epsilon subunit family exonuclease
MRLSDLEIVAFDLETTGLWPVSCRIVEFGAVRFKLNGKVLDRFEQLVDPGCGIPDSVVQVHGITNELIRGKPTISDVLPRFLKFLGPSETFLLAHNAKFDLGFLAVALVQCGELSPHHAIVDTLELARRRLPLLANHQLQTLGVCLGVADTEEHRALADSTLLKDVFRMLVGLRPHLRTTDELFEAAPPLSFNEANVSLIGPPKGFEAIGSAVAQELSITMLYEGGTRGTARRKVTPRGFLEAKGRVYLVAFCHVDRIEKHYRLDRIRQFNIERG